jgi:hypothetical protein
MQSLPKRTGRVPVEGEDGEYMRDENGDIAKFGTLAGIVVFPPNSHAPLLRAWLQRQGNVTLGQNRKIVNAIGHARPDAAAVEVLKEKVGEIRPAITKALPRPRRT